MIPKSSQRGNAADLAAHLLNAEDNEYVEVMALNGTIADDLAGGLREIEAAYLATTKGKNPFFTLIVSPQVNQPWNDDLTYDYCSRVLQGLNLEGQPHGLVRHLKAMADGVPREHFHLVVSRLDINECKSIPISFDHIKLMQITREFARDHDLELPPGYYNYDDRQQQTYRQVSLYEKSLTDHGHPTRAEHQDIITPLWEGRVSPEGFIKALDHHGYMLAFGKRPVVIDVFGKEHSLARLIANDDAKVASIRAFLGDHYSEETLPSVDDAKELVSDHIAKTKEFERSEVFAEKLDALKTGQTIHREKLEARLAEKRLYEKSEFARAEKRALAERQTHRRAFLDHRREIRKAREETKPTGLAAFLGRVTGFTLIQKKIHKHRDKQQFTEHIEAKHEMVERHKLDQEELRMAHQMNAFDAERQRRELAYSEAQEIRSLERHFEREARLEFRQNNPAPTPAPVLELTPFGRRAVPVKAMNRFTGSSYKDRATPEEFAAENVASQDDDALAPTVPDGEKTVGKKRGSILSPDSQLPNIEPLNPITPTKETEAPDQEPEHTPSMMDVPTREVSVNHDFQREWSMRKQTQTLANQLTEEFDKAASAEESTVDSSTESGEIAPNQHTQSANTQDISLQQKPEMNLDFTVGDLPEPGMLTTQFDTASAANQPTVIDGDSANSAIETVPADTASIADPSHSSDFDHNLE